MNHQQQFDLQLHSPILQQHQREDKPSSLLGAYSPLSKNEIERLKQLEGECRIVNTKLLRLDYPKAFFFALLMTTSVIGLLFLKYYVSLRAVLFYTTLTHNEAQLATHIYVKDSAQNQQICIIQHYQFQGRRRKVFVYKHLRYQFDQISFPLGISYPDIIHKYLGGAFQGLEQEQAKQRASFLGKNQHIVQIPGYFSYLFDIMTQPFFIMQYLVSAVYIMENVAIFSILMIVFGFITTSANYVLLYRSYQRIKESAERHFHVIVLRDGQFKTVENVDMVCGDVFAIDNEIPCDSVLVEGEAFVDQANLTGESVPIPKFKLTHQREIQQSNRWVFEGSKVKKKKEGTLAMAINLGFGSRRGRIIRQILTKKPKQPQLLTKLIYFMVEVLLISLLLYAGVITQMLFPNIEKIMIFFKLLELITYSLPVGLPIFYNLAYSFSLIRLRSEGIYGTDSEKTIQGARVRTVCFDKTGTLTHNSMRITSVFSVHEEEERLVKVDGIKAQNHSLIEGLFGCCNSVQKINDSYEGDEIDLEMFHHVKAEIVQIQDISSDVIRCIQILDRLLQVLKINQYESKFQSMSVLYKDQKNRYFVVVKGSPEMIHRYSDRKIKGFDGFIKELSLQGFRSIAFGYREISERETSCLLKADREAFLKGINMLGVATFVNLLKQDAESTISALTQADINTKIITGDNIFLGVQTALMTGMIPKCVKIIVLQGGKFSGGGRVEITQLERLVNGEITESQSVIDDFRFSNEEGIAYAIDNEFIDDNPEDFLHARVKVFARITPENKALIVRKHKEMIAAKIKRRSAWKRVFGECSLKVGMVGDGANDLIAIKEADVGIGIKSTDAVYSAAFVIKDLSQIITILCQAKSTERQLVDLTQYSSILGFICVTTMLILITDIAELTNAHEIYRNFNIAIPVTLQFALSKPAKELTKFQPNSNFMGLENHLVFWGTSLILGAGQIGAYLYYYQSNDFVPNPHPYVSYRDGWNGVCKSSTVNFLIIIVEYTLLPIVIYRSSPWKEEIYKNLFLLSTIIINLVLIIAIFIETANLSILDLLPINYQQAGVVFAITIFACVDCVIVGRIIQGSKMHEAVTALQSKEIMIGVQQGNFE